MYNRNKILTERCLPQLSVLRYEDKIKFKSFFAFVVLVFLAWFNRLGLSKIGPKWQVFFQKWQIKKSQTTRNILPTKMCFSSSLQCFDWLNLNLPPLSFSVSCYKSKSKTLCQLSDCVDQIVRLCTSFC